MSNVFKSGLPVYPRVRLVATMEMDPKRKINRPVKIISVHPDTKLDSDLYDAELIKNFDKAFWTRIVMNNLNILGHLTFEEIREFKDFMDAKLNEQTIMFNTTRKVIEIPVAIRNIISHRARVEASIEAMKSINGYREYSASHVFAWFILAVTLSTIIAINRMIITLF